jgi:two-component system phosphate regulon sensor histidine kinase PhoR
MYEPYPVPELAREQKLSVTAVYGRLPNKIYDCYFFLDYCKLNWFGDWYFWSYTIAFCGFFSLQLRSLYLVNDWISNRPYDVPPNLNGIWGHYCLMFIVHSAKNVLFKRKWSD